MFLAHCIDVATQKPTYEVADVFRAYLDDYLQCYHPSPDEWKAINAILACRTAALGGYLRVCDVCGKVQIAYCSCKNRHCPKCGHFEQAQWLARQAALLLPVPHYHVVFTTDHLLNDLAAVNPEAVYSLLFQTAGKLLKAYGQTYLGGEVGATMVLHTWGQTLQPHIHLHGMVTGGALAPTAEGYAWRESKKTFLFPVVKLARDFRDALCAGLLKLYRRGELRLVGACAGLDVEGLVAQMQAKAWEVYIQQPVAGVEKLLDYLGRYVFRTAMANHRIVGIEDGQVAFEYIDNKDKDEGKRGKVKVMTLAAVEFMRRFLRHVLPKGFVRIRHYGLYAGGMRLKLQVARLLLGQSFELPDPPKLELSEWLASFSDEDPFRCPFCGVGRMRRGRAFAPIRGFALWLLMLLGLPVLGEAPT